MNDIKNRIISLNLQGSSNSEILQALKPLNVNRWMINRTIERYHETGSTKDRPRSGRPRTVCTKDRIKRVREKIRRNPERSARRLAKEENVSATSMRRLLAKDLGLKPYRKRKIHGLSDEQKKKRLERSKLLLKRHGVRKVKKIIFSDEKLFLTEQCHNAKNDVVYSLSFEDIPEEQRTVKRFQNKSSVKVLGAISENGKLPLLFIDKGIKINGDFYRQEVILNHLVPEAKKLYPSGDWIFQQDSAPSHSANDTQKLLKNHSLDFITKEDWPPSSPDLNPLDYSIWGTLEARVNAKFHRSLDSLKRALIREWKKLPMDHVRAAIGSWRHRLSKVVGQEGGRFE